MNAIDPDPDAEERSAGAHRYFRAIEDRFISLRGAPLLLSPADHLVARTWFANGIPFVVVARALEGVFARRRERGASGKVSSLRYCRSAVEKEWKRVSRLQAADIRAPASGAEEPGLEIAARLAALGARLPESLPGGQAWARRLSALGGDAEGVENQLATLDDELIEAVASAMTSSERQELTAAVEKALRALAPRLTSEQLQVASQQLHKQLLRQRFDLPLLTLFES